MMPAYMDYNMKSGNKITITREFLDFRADSISKTASVRINDFFANSYNGIIPMQSTGYGDIDGQEMFESDVVELNGVKAVIRWGDASFYFDPIDDDWLEDWCFPDDASRMRIIGNIHENPELLQ